MINKVVITAALAGGFASKKNHPSIPYTAQEFIDEAVRCEKAGASVVHIHARHPETGNPTSKKKYLIPIVEGIREKTDLIINLSTGVSMDSSPEERKRPIIDFNPEMASLNPGTMNFCLYDKRKNKFELDETFHNPFSLTIDFAKTMKNRKIKPELECFDIGHVSNTFWLFREGLVNEPVHYSFVFGVIGGISFSVENLACMRSNIPHDSTWQPIGVGPSCFPAAMAAAIMGGHIRVGLEDNLYINFSKRQKSLGSWDQVEKAVSIAKFASREPATPAEARKILNLRQLKGAGNSELNKGEQKYSNR